jgi:hypothetical protein
MEIVWDARASKHSAGHHLKPASTQGESNIAVDWSITNIDAHFYYLSQYKVIICRKHQTGVQNIDVHLRRHHAVPTKNRREIAEHFISFLVEAPKDVELPRPLGSPIDELGEPLDGFQCTQEECDHITVNNKALRSHCKQIHGLSWKGDTARLYNKVKVQTFFRAPGLQRYFVVYDSQPIATPAARQERHDQVETLLGDWDRDLQLHEEEAQVMDTVAAKTDRTGWFNRTGWLEHFANRNLRHLAHAARLPGPNESKLVRAAECTKELVERSVAGLQTLPRETRWWLRSAKAAEINQRPMG